MPPQLLGPWVAFASFDGYVHAVERRKGSGGWRTDLPARVSQPPVQAGGRLDFLLPLTGYAVAVSSDNGAILDIFFSSLFLHCWLPYYQEP